MIILFDSTHVHTQALFNMNMYTPPFIRVGIIVSLASLIKYFHSLSSFNHR